ncbi:hypothetical protein [Chamaesiphon sp. OTE_75_metabat_556]|uniref:hypothetical protein n=1 Tax=Chamaesiphon sp. OTE_75_metabat_556 TaxID=2964692 RepID=UPI00286A0469|nr:hypothetical protein [Chamaesiphon sp. OTE_75_metabat_556]
METPVILAKTRRKIGNNNLIDSHSGDRHQIGSTASARGKIAKIVPTISVPVVRGQRFDRK